MLPFSSSEMISFAHSSQLKDVLHRTLQGSPTRRSLNEVHFCTSLRASENFCSESNDKVRARTVTQAEVQHHIRMPLLLQASERKIRVE